MTRPDDEAILRLERVSKSFGPQPVLIDCDIELARGEFVTLLGPSGCGKSTTLNLVAGFLQVDAGRIFLRGKRADRLRPQSRNLGMVFQSWALFPHMNVFDNVAFGLRMKGMPRHDLKRRVMEMLELVQLSLAAAKYPSQLSGGMQQRVALARALATDPSVLLLDEPLSNLDAALRREMQIQLKHIHERLGVTTLLVTHNQEEALVMSDRIAVMRAGRIERIADPVSIYNDPGTTFVCEFLGETNLVRGTVVSSSGPRVTVDADGWLFDVERTNPPNVGERVIVSIRPEHVRLEIYDARSAGALRAVVTESVFLGSQVTYYISAKDHKLTAVRGPEARGILAAGTEVELRFDPGAASFVTESEGAL